MSHTQTNPYLPYALTKPQAWLRLFCFPYAGGSARIFQKWSSYFPSTIEVCPLQYPGRGNRMREQPFTRVTRLVEDMTERLLPLLDQPFAFFGHSLGAIVAFEMACQLRTMRRSLPVHLFVSASRAPQLGDRGPVAYDLPEPKFIEELRRLNGTATEVLEDSELMRLMLPMLRADFEAAQTYNYSPQAPLSCPLSVYGGLTDHSVLRQNLEDWRAHTTSSFTLQMFPGDHFYLHSAESQLMHRLSSELAQHAGFQAAPVA